jgi:hypothetical protein
MPSRDWAAIRVQLISVFNPVVEAQFGQNPTTQQQQLMSELLIKSNDSSLIAQSRITLFNQMYPQTYDAYAAIPDGWPLRPEHNRPQCVYQFAEVDADGNIIDSPKYSINIPHHQPQQVTEGLPNYQKGNWEIIYVLSDNSKITIHSYDETNGMTVLNAAKNLVIPSYLEGAYTSKSSLVSGGYEIAQINVKCRMAKYFSTGAKNVKPDWISKFS